MHGTKMNMTEMTVIYWDNNTRRNNTLFDQMYIFLMLQLVVTTDALNG